MPFLLSTWYVTDRPGFRLTTVSALSLSFVTVSRVSFCEYPCSYLFPPPPLMLLPFFVFHFLLLVSSFPFYFSSPLFVLFALFLGAFVLLPTTLWLVVWVCGVRGFLVRSSAGCWCVVSRWLFLCGGGLTPLMSWGSRFFRD